jgi:hypothetical protein
MRAAVVVGAEVGSRTGAGLTPFDTLPDAEPDPQAS